jgi:hypothetical protein
VYDVEEMDDITYISMGIVPYLGCRFQQSARIRDLMTCLMITGSPHVPSSCISLARFTRPYAPLPISRSITNSDMLRSVRKTLGSLSGVGAPTLATLWKLVALFVRTSLVVAGGGEGGST